MGFLKKIFKPVSKVLDKVLPNEIKPFLPYAAAFAPFIAPGIMGTSVLQRAAMGGGLNIFGQLAQEGNEGDINLLSAGLGALSGAMTAPGQQATTARGDLIAKGKIPDFSMSAPGEAPILREFNTRLPGFGAERVVSASQPSASQFFTNLSKGAEGSGIMASGQRFLGDTLAKGSDIMSAGLRDGLFSKAGMKAAILPGATATGDLMFAQAKRDQDEYDRMMEEDAASDAESDAQRAFAIRRAMEATGATEEEIEDAIYAAGYKTGGRVGFKYGGGDIDLLEEMKKMVIAEPASIDEDQIEETEEGFKIKSKDIPIIVEPTEYDEDREVPVQFLNMKKGGRVGLRFGGIGAAVDQIDNQEMKEAAQFASMLNDMDVPIADLAEEFEIQFKRKPNSLEELKQFYKDRYDYKGPGDVKMKEEIKEKVVMEAKDGGLMNLGGKEMDLRKGGFVPIGKKERADDVPARLSKNEFVMTADAVRAAGGGSVNKGAKRMYDIMNKLEARA